VDRITGLDWTLVSLSEFRLIGGAGAPGAGGSGRGGAPIPVPTEVMQQILEGHDRDWAEDRIPALDGRTPREAVRTPEGRAAVIGLLKLYEQGEARSARKEGREPASLQFLWDAVWLDRDEVLGG